MDEELKLGPTRFLVRNFPFTFESEIAWRWNRRFRRHPSSAPFLSGDTFRAHADIVIEEDGEFARESAGRRQLVFCASSRAAQVLASNSLPEHSVLLLHHGDTTISEDIIGLLERNKFAHCFAQNCSVEDPRITPLPIGLEDQRLHANGHVVDFLRLRKAKVEKRPRIIWGFNLDTNPDARMPCYRALISTRMAVPLPRCLNPRLYRREILPYMFLASPPGNGEDCHRTWEAMYLRIVPIVKRSIMTRYFAGLGLPMLLVDDWRELSTLKEHSLAETYQKLSPGFDSPALWVDYWMHRFAAHLSPEAP